MCVCVCVCVCVSLRRRSFADDLIIRSLSVRVQRRVNEYRRNVRSCKYTVCCAEEYVAQCVYFNKGRIYLAVQTLGAFPLQICAKLWRNVINVDKKVFRNYGVSINQCFATKS